MGPKLKCIKFNIEIWEERPSDDDVTCDHIPDILKDSNKGEIMNNTSVVFIEVKFT